MARMAVADLEAAAAVNTGCLQRPPEAHCRSCKRHELAVAAPLPEIHEMSELRNRVQTGPSPRARPLDDEDSAESSPALTPSSTEGSGQALEDSGLLSIVKSVSYSLLTFTKLTPSPRCTPEEAQELSKSLGYDKLKYERVDDFPKGYPQLAAFANSCDTFANVRRFGRLSYRILAHLQNDLTDMEKTLDELDNKDAKDKKMEKRLRGYENFAGWDEEQRKLISKISATYSQYADIVLKDAGLRALGKCPPRNAKALFTWVWNRKPLAIGAGRCDFIFYPDDFVSLAGQSQSDRLFENFIESFLDRHPYPWIKSFLKPETELRKTDDEFVDHYSLLKLKILANILEVSLAVLLLLIPVYLLFLVPMSRAMMAVVASVFVILFSVVVSSATGAKVQDVFFGSAAQVFAVVKRFALLTRFRYAAVIIMFLGNLTSSTSSTAGS